MLFAAFFCLFAGILCTLGVYFNIKAERPGWAVVMAILAIMDYGCFVWDIYRYNHPEEEQLQTYVVKDVKEYYVDSTITINGADTTKTYVLTYLK